MHGAISRAAGVGDTSARFGRKRAWSGCYIQKIDAALKSYCIKKRFNGQRRNWREEVAIGLCAPRRRPFVECPRLPIWVKLRRTQCEHMFSGLPPIADIDVWHLRDCGKCEAA